MTYDGAPDPVIAGGEKVSNAFVDTRREATTTHCLYVKTVKRNGRQCQRFAHTR